MYNIGIDIGSTASKVVVMNEDKSEIVEKKVMPSGWNMRETSDWIYSWLDEGGYVDDSTIVATGYGRISVPYSNQSVTEITCHAKGAEFLFGDTLNIIDIGGQDTKFILMKNGMVSDFLMNDKCAAGTGRFVEVMADRLSVTLKEMFDQSVEGDQDLKLNSMCTVFSESEVISLMGEGKPKMDISAAVINSIANKVAGLVKRKRATGDYFLTGGFCNNQILMDKLGERLDATVYSHEDGRYAGAIGAACAAK